MERQQVSSGNLRSVGYDLLSSVLKIEFNNGDTYQYYDVPEPDYLALMNASSRESYHHKHIKYRYRYKRIR
jgi:hypothetical protein